MTFVPEAVTKYLSSSLYLDLRVASTESALDSLGTAFQQTRFSVNLAGRRSGLDPSRKSTFLQRKCVLRRVEND